MGGITGIKGLEGHWLIDVWSNPRFRRYPYPIQPADKSTYNSAYFVSIRPSVVSANQEHTMEIVSFNGKTYNSLEEMPADQRAAYEQVMAFMKDENNNGIPDLFEGDVVQKMIGLAANTHIVVNGQEMQGLEALPP